MMMASNDHVLTSVLFLFAHRAQTRQVADRCAVNKNNKLKIVIITRDDVGGRHTRRFSAGETINASNGW